MSPPREYRTPQAFKVALEDRLRKRASASGVHVNRVRQKFVMERFVARLVGDFSESFMVKGGLALELRLADARSTKDVDLHMRGDPDQMLDRLHRAAGNDLGDRLSYGVEADPEHPDIDDAVYEGRRLRVVATIAAQPYGAPFGVDVGFGDAVVGAPDILRGEDFLDFVGLPPLVAPGYPVETHVAEKLHAYTRTMPGGRVNSRVRDLPDMALLATVKAFDARTLRVAMKATFDLRSTHPLPHELPDPPRTWVALYAALAAEQDLPWKDITEVTVMARRFLDPVLAGAVGRWNRANHSWDS